MEPSCEALCTLDALHALTPHWNALWARCPDATLFQRPEWILPYCRHLLHAELRVLCLWSEQRLVGLAPFFRWTEGERGVLSLLGAGVSDYQDVLVEAEHRGAAQRVLARWLSHTREEHPRWEWSELRGESLLCTLRAEASRTDRLQSQECCLALDLPAQWSELLPGLTKKLRYDLGHARRRAQRQALHFSSADEESFETWFHALVALHQARRASLDEPSRFARAAELDFQREAARALMSAGLLRLHGFWHEDAPGGAICAFRDRQTLRLYQCGFDPALHAYSPGTLLIGFALEQAIEEGLRCADFMRGQEPYKGRWGATSRTLLMRRSVQLST